MKRDYTREIYLSKVDYLRKVRPGIALSTDIIVGFPGETEEDFQLTMDVVNKVQFANIYSFKYSPRKFTAALKMSSEEISEEEKSNRLTRLQDLQRKHDVELSGRTMCNRVVNFKGTESWIGSFQTVQIETASANSLYGTPSAL
jgi:tRNA-2-methylthio-N6-dimethylallyladenosine synthase